MRSALTSAHDFGEAETLQLEALEKRPVGERMKRVERSDLRLRELVGAPQTGDDDATGLYLEIGTLRDTIEADRRERRREGRWTRKGGRALATLLALAATTYGAQRAATPKTPPTHEAP